MAIRESQAALEASLRRESAAVSELARRDAEEARRVEQVRALLAASIAAPASGSCSGSGSVDSNAGAVGSSVAATALSDLAALEEAIEERAREVASLKVCMMHVDDVGWGGDELLFYVRHETPAACGFYGSSS